MSRRRKKKTGNLIFILILIIGLIIGFYFYKKDNITMNNININVTKKPTLYRNLGLDDYEYLYKISSDFACLVKDNTIYYLDIKNSQITDINSLIQDEEHFKLRLGHYIHQKFNLSKGDTLRSKEFIYLFKEHELSLYFDEYNSEDYVNINYNEIKEFLLFEPEYDLNYEIEDSYELDPNKTTIAFTFDDGPNGKKTIELIETLEKYGYSATFFIVGNHIKSGNSAVKRVNNSHSEIGYHSYQHAYLTRQETEVIQSEYKTSDELLFSYTGSHFKLIRPPYGSYSDRVLESLELVFVGWNLDTNDWKYKDTQNAKNYVLNNYKDGAIILFHDLFTSSIEAVKQVAPILKEKGVQVTTVSRLAKLKGITLENHQIYKSLKK